MTTPTEDANEQPNIKDALDNMNVGDFLKEAFDQFRSALKGKDGAPEEQEPRPHSLADTCTPPSIPAPPPAPGVGPGVG